MQTNHNLNIHMYSLEEVLGLFDLKYQLTIDDLKRAKKKVLMLHPDKSKLSAEYFLFYKKAFDIIVQFYENQNKQNKAVENIDYKPLNGELNKTNTKNVTSAIKEMNPEKFQSKFNQLFEENMAKKPNSSKNEWFAKDEPIYNIDQNVNASNMRDVLENMKQNNGAIINYRGVENLYSSGSGTNVHDDDDVSDNSYVTSDPFSKLKYDDLRKVHKDQTVFAVSERDFEKVQTYSSVDHFVRERSRQSLDPMEKQKAEQVLAAREREMQEEMMKRQYQSNLRTMQYEEKNKAVLSSFMMLENKR
jgi:hypothetical protein